MGVENVWEVLAPDGDQPWLFLGELTDRPEAERAAIIVDALKIVVDRTWADAEDAVVASMAAFLVAVARSPRNLAGRRDAVLRFTSTEFGVATLARLVGDLTMLRTPEVAELALGATDWVGRTWLPGLHRLPGESERLSAALDGLRAAIQAPTLPWTAADDRPKRPRGRPTPWMVPGEILTIDLGDGFRTYAQLGPAFDVAVHDVREPTDAEVLPIDEVIGRPVLFNVTVNQFFRRPRGWRTVGRIPEGRPLLPRATRFRQGPGDAQCYLIIDGDWEHQVPTTQQECVGLERGGASWHPADVEQRARDHYAGRPDTQGNDLRVRISRSVVRVCTRMESYALNEPGDPPQLFGPPSLLARLASGYGPGRTDLVMVEADEAILAIRPHPVDADDPDSPLVSGSHGLLEPFVLGRFPLRPLPDGGYEPVEPWTPQFP